MKHTIFNQCKLLVQSLIHQSPEEFKTLKTLTLIQKHTLFSNLIQTKLTTNMENTVLPRSYSFFPRKTQKIPIKCRIKINECGQKVAEPYEAKQPSCHQIPAMSKDFTMNPEEHCMKLQEKVVSYNPPPPGPMPRRSIECPETKFACPNALTKYLKTRGSCKEIYRGIETNDCIKKKDCDKVKKATYTGRDCALDDPCKMKKNQVAVPQIPKKRIVDDILTKLKSKKLMKQSGFLHEDLIKETFRKLSTNRGSNEILTCVKDTSNAEKSPDMIKLRVQNLDKPVSGRAKGFDKTYASDEAIFEDSLPEKNFYLDSLDEVSPNLIFPGVMSIATKIKRKKTADAITEKAEIGGGDDLRTKKTRKDLSKKAKNKKGIRRKRRKIRWFSRIPIQPNMKGSVIFQNGSAQKLDDPCKILSVNFSASNLNPSNEQSNFELDESRCDSSVDNTMNSYDYILQKLENDYSKVEEAKYLEDKQLFDQNTYPPKPEDKDVKVKNKNINYQKERRGQKMVTPFEPIVRQKKVSKLDRTVKCFTTTVQPDTHQINQKTFRRRKKYSKTSFKPGSSDNLNATSLDIKTFPKTVSSAAFTNGYHSTSTSHVLKNFKSAENCKEIRGDGLNSRSLVKIKDISPINESGDENETGKGSFHGFKKNLSISPAITRPVTQKAAHLNLLEIKATTPVSNAWKRNLAKNKHDKKKVMASTSGPESIEAKGVNFQQTRFKSTNKSALSWRSKCNVRQKPCPHQKKNYNELADSLPPDWDTEEGVPKEVARKWNTWECPEPEDIGCPITSDDLKHGVPHKNPVSASAINRCNLEECKNRLRCRKPVSKCRNSKSSVRPLGPGK